MPGKVEFLHALCCSMPAVDSSLPIAAALPALRAQLAAQRLVVLKAPPGAGKSTVAPLALLDEPWLRGQRILMLEPRRLAARTVAARMSSVMGESVGQTVGYRVRFDSRVGPRTRIEVLTEGILTRRLQGDPSLDGVGLVIFDEFHERSLHADLALALCRDVQGALRDDLRMLIMSATLDEAAMRAALGDVPIVAAEGRQHEVTVTYAQREPDGFIANAVADAVSRALAEQPGDVLAFLPGVSEIQRAQSLLEARHADVLIRPLYGELSLDAQQAAITPDASGQRKVVLATSIAETSLTIEGIRVVVDSGLARVPRFDPRTGLTRLETVRITRDSADQRAGRAGRLGPGDCYRLWTTQMHSRLNPTRTPEILEADLAPMRLELAQWGVRDASELRWITPPPTGALRQAQSLLQQLGAMRGSQLTERGKQMLEWSTHPRLAHMLIEAMMQTRDASLPALAADLAALLDERDPLPRDASADLTLRVEALRHWRRTNQSLRNADVRTLARIERLAAQWRSQMNIRADNMPPDPFALGWLVTLAYPERIGQARSGDNRSGRYRLSGGSGARLAEGDPLVHAPWLAVAHLDAGKSGAGEEGRVYLAAPVHVDDLEPLVTEHDVVGWDAKQGSLVARRERRIGELVLSAKPISNVPMAERMRALCDVVRAEGMTLLNWTDAAVQWQARVQSLHLWRDGDWPDVSDDALLARLDDWLTSWLERVSRRADFARLEVLTMLSALLSRKQITELDRLAPTHVAVPSGSHIRLTYAVDGAPPVLAVKLQEMFGLADTPAVNEGRTPVMLHLLSPAQRPIQVTQDLRSFWANTYPSVRKELRGRYNKHPWPEDPWHAPPTRKTVRRTS